MTIYGAFNIATMGMMSQAYALNTIGANIANVNTGGYKRTETEFKTVLSEQLYNHRDLGGAAPKDFQRVREQGIIVASASDLEVSINGQGFFLLNTAVDGSGQALYGRDGAFEVKTVNDVTVTGIGGTNITVKDGYLADKNGYFVMGWAREADGTIPTTGTPGAMRVDPYAFVDSFETTTEAHLGGLNLPASASNGEIEEYAIQLVDSNGARQVAKVQFQKTDTGTWYMSALVDDTTAQVDSIDLSGGGAGTVDVGDVYTVTVNGVSISHTATATDDFDTIKDSLLTAINNHSVLGQMVTATDGGVGTLTLTGTAGGIAFASSATDTDGSAAQSTTTAASGSTTVQELVFGSDGTLSTPSPISLSLTWPGGGTGTVALDVSKMTQFAGDFSPGSYTSNGYASATLESFEFTQEGYVVGTFNDNTQRNLYRMTLATFTNPDGLEAKNGNVWAESPESGDPYITTAQPEGYAEFMPNSHELSNVDIADEFTRMMRTQHAYKASSTVFRTVDEMTEVARDLKG